MVPALQLRPEGACCLPGFSFPIWSLLYLDATDGQILERSHFNYAFGCVPCRGGLEAFWVSFDSLPRWSHRKGSLGAQWRPGDVWGVGQKLQLEGCWRGLFEARQTCQLVWRWVGMPFIKMPKSRWLGSTEGLVCGCRCYKLPGNVVFCILLRVFVKNQKREFKGEGKKIW